MVLMLRNQDSGLPPFLHLLSKFSSKTLFFSLKNDLFSRIWDREHSKLVTLKGRYTNSHNDWANDLLLQMKL